MQTDDAPPKVAILQAQIQALSDLYNRIPTIRHIPPVLLKPSPITPTLRAEFHQLKEIGDTIRSDPVQEALRTARESLRLDATELNSNPRRESRKRRYVPANHPTRHSSLYFLPRFFLFCTLPIIDDLHHRSLPSRMLLSNAGARHSSLWWRRIVIR